MNNIVRQRAAKIFLLIAIIWFSLCGLVYDFAPFWFPLIAALFAIFPVKCGLGRVRIVGTGIISGAFLAAIVDYNIARTLRMDGKSITMILCAFALALICIAAFIGLHWLVAARAKAILRIWAAENNYEVINCSEERFLLDDTGPFKWWTNSRGQIIYSIRVRCGDGSERSGWVRCGSYLGGVFSGTHIEARWAETRRAS